MNQLQEQYFSDKENKKKGELIVHLLNLLEQKEPGLKEHALNVTTYASMMKEALPLNKKGTYGDLLIASLLHDTGKLAIPGKVLNKHGKLNNIEWELIKKHSELGVYILESLSLSHDVKKGILHHHEKWDGSGYPLGLNGAEIPLIARMIAIADSFDAMVMLRPYKEKKSFLEALKDLEENKGIKYDPELVDLFVVNIKKHLARL